MTNGQREKLNSTLIYMLGMLLEKTKNTWIDHVGTLPHAYNCIYATKFSLYYLMHSRKPKLPFELCFGTNSLGLTAATSTKPYNN